MSENFHRCIRCNNPAPSIGECTFCHYDNIYPDSEDAVETLVAWGYILTVIMSGYLGSVLGIGWFFGAILGGLIAWKIPIIPNIVARLLGLTILLVFGLIALVLVRMVAS